MTPISILGAGAFGTALAIAFARDGRPVSLWARDPEHAAQVQRSRLNARRLPGAVLPDSVVVTADLGQALDPQTILLAVPMQQIGGFLAELDTDLDGKHLIACCKGVDARTGLGPSQIIAEAVPASVPAILTGPSFAVDIAKGLPTALTLAVAQDSTGKTLQTTLACQTLRLYLTDDVIGAELGGALKNVIALAAGITIGAGLGESARAAVITRGFAELQRYATFRGARAETLAGLSGLGDLILTCSSEKSRNFAAGLALGAGRELDPTVTVEGIATAKAVSNAAKLEGIDVPITTMVDAVLDRRISVKDAANALLSRPLKKE
jgi:glycerol-3-phosphate dehydrogenase (NAD(P)+)